ncbi:LOW QUALITY PROTEIN: cyclin-dependent kinase-like 3 [Macrobrachium rosenbergii]|uniref:LOW QUALITY PROTEIN: cyclin-dependent kinase-like 3 n=1 Tax=Macrobrachium rosenbergii TaxID=79674 RepID=UPI0034D6125A
MERYESLGIVGEGSYGIVLRCRHKETGQTVAIKKFLESEDDHTVKKIALREVRMLKKLRHENLVNLIEFFRRKRRLYLVFEYVDHTILDELESSETGLEESKARAHIFQVLRGIAFCHQNQIIHRDIKPENVLVSRLGVVKLCDFGFARLLAGPGESCTDYVATRWYRAPELLVGDTRYGREVDIWACGCLLSEMLTGEPLFPGESDIDQLFHIIQTLGELSTSHRQLMERNPMLAGLKLPAAASTPLMGSFPSWSSRAHSFVAACLCLEPTARPHAQSLLSHDFFIHDGFPEAFLPILRQKVQQEFSGNVLLGVNGRRGSSTNEKRGRVRKGPGGHSPESIYGRSIARPLPPQVTSTTSRSENALSVRASPTKQPTFCQPSQSTPASKPSVSFAPLTPSHQRSSGISGPNSLAPAIAEDAPLSPRSSLIPPLRDSHTIITSSVISNPVPTTSTSNNNTIALTLNITGTTNTASPARNSRVSEKGRKSPVNLWGTNSKSRGQALCIQGQGQGIGSSHINWEDDDNFGMALDGPSSFTSCNRQIALESNKNLDSTRNIDLSRHPYTISLDRTKELFGRDSSYRDNSSHREFTRDPLREIRDNPRDPLGLNKELRESIRRPKLEMGWAKPRLLNDDLSLPNVPGGALSNNGSSSPKKNSNSVPGSSSWIVGNKPPRPGVIMPLLSNNKSNSATSSDSTPPSSPLANLPFV